MMFLKSKIIYIYAILFAVTVFVSLPLFAQSKSDNNFSEGETATIKKVSAGGVTRKS